MILCPDYSTTDFHSHILPYMDHGCVDDQMAEAALKEAQAVGIHTICATSHFYPNEHRVDEYLEKRAVQIERLQPVAEKYGIRLIPGAEVQVQNDISQCGDLSKLYLTGMDSILIELPFTREITHQCLDHVYRLMVRNHLQVIIAHPDRYPLDIVDQCLSFGCVLQLNVEPTTEHKTKKQAVRWIKDNSVFGFGTDFHREPEKSYSTFKKVIHLVQKYN